MPSGAAITNVSTNQASRPTRFATPGQIAVASSRQAAAVRIAATSIAAVNMPSRNHPASGAICSAARTTRPKITAPSQRPVIQ